MHKIAISYSFYIIHVTRLQLIRMIHYDEKTNECALREHYLIISRQGGKENMRKKRKVNKLFSFNMLHDIL